MTCSFYLLESAQKELEGIVQYLNIASGGSAAANSLLSQVEKQIERVCDNPPLFALSRIPELAALGYRSALVGSYVLLYFYRDDIVFVAHIFHQRQDYARLV